MNGPIVVGVDGTEPSLIAVDLAADEAARHGRPLLVVHADPWLSSTHVPTDARPSEAERIVAQAVARAHAAEPTVDVGGHVAPGFPQQVLAELSRTASTIVIGDRGLGVLARMFADPVAGDVAVHAHCPVLIARGGAVASGTVVVGVSGTAAGEAAIGYAFEAAALRDCRLEAVHAWSQPMSSAPGDMLPLVYDPALVEAAEDQALAEALAGWRGQYPDVPVRRVARRGRADRVLLDAAAGAQLLVVGSGNCRAAEGRWLGAVSRSVSRHAPCPVAIVPHTRPARLTAASGAPGIHGASSS